MSKVVAEVTELDSISLEIKNLSKRLKVLRDRKKEIEKDILIFLEEKDQIGMKYKGNIIKKDVKNTRQTIPKDEKNEQLTEILRKNGVRNSAEVIKELTDIFKGTEIKKECLKIRKI